MDYPFSYLSVLLILVGIVAVLYGIYATAIGSAVGFVYYLGIVMVVTGVILAYLDFRGKLPDIGDFGKKDN